MACMACPLDFELSPPADNGCISLGDFATGEASTLRHRVLCLGLVLPLPLCVCVCVSIFMLICLLRCSCDSRAEPWPNPPGRTPRTTHRSSSDRKPRVRNDSPPHRARPVSLNSPQRFGCHWDTHTPQIGSGGLDAIGQIISIR